MPGLEIRVCSSEVTLGKKTKTSFFPALYDTLRHALPLLSTTLPLAFASLNLRRAALTKTDMELAQYGHD